MEIKIERLWSAPETSEHRATTTGIVSLDDKQSCFCLEPTALMVLPGRYGVSMEWSERFQRHTPHINVPGHTNIEMHGGNKAEDSDACVLCADKRLSEYEIYDSPPSTDAIESELRLAEANGENSFVTILDIPGGK